MNLAWPIFAILLMSSFVFAEEKNEIMVALNSAKSKAKELYEYEQVNKPIALKELGLTRPVSKAVKKLQCRGHKYKYYNIKHSDGSVAIYGISQPKDGGVVIGRHITIPLNPEASSKTITASTKSCLEIKEAKEHQNILFTTHLLSFTPNMFHVYQSINYKTTIYVGTDVAKWKVNNGEIGILK